MFKSITLEMSLKPFKKTDGGYIENVCREIFSDWRPLCEDAEEISLLLWVGDGSELIEYKGDLSEKTEWGRYIGNANPRNKFSDTARTSLFATSYYYTDNPPVITYGVLKLIIDTVKRIGKEMFPDKKIRVGETFDPGPEFAKSEFKYSLHSEVCVGGSLGASGLVCCYKTLKADNCRYAAYPDGIPDNTSFATFFGKQAQIFLSDMGFDYIWFSNGFGFGSEPWGTMGAIFDGKDFKYERLPKIKEDILSFWRLFRKECPDFPVETRGTNLTMGIDLARDGVPLKEIYDGNFGMLPPPNSPWAALNGDFGLELAGHMSRIGKIPGDKYMFRYYLHDPWWANSPWYDRYESMPHDIYMPMAITRIDENGEVKGAEAFSILSIDNSFGDMPKSCFTESLPHMLKAEKETPDKPPVLVWVYPFDEYSAAATREEVTDMFSCDWLVRGAINNGLPLSGVVTTDNFTKFDGNNALYAQSILLSPVPKKDSPYESAILDFIENGGKVIFYGSVSRAGERFLNLAGIEITDGISGTLPLEVFEIDEGEQPAEINHRPLFSGGDLNTRMRENAETKPFAKIGDRVCGVYGKGFAWVRGTVSCRFVEDKHLLEADDPSKLYRGEKLLRTALYLLGVKISFSLPAPKAKPPVIMISRKNNAYLFSSYTPSSSVKISLELPQGAPILSGYEAVVKNKTASYHFPLAEHRECRVFAEQEEGLITCREAPPASNFYRRRIRVEGLKNATVRFFPEEYCADDVGVLLNPTDETNAEGRDCVCGEYKNDEKGRYFEAKNVTGTLLFSMPVKKNGNGRKEQQ